MGFVPMFSPIDREDGKQLSNVWATILFLTFSHLH